MMGDETLKVTVLTKVGIVERSRVIEVGMNSWRSMSPDEREEICREIGGCLSDDLLKYLPNKEVDDVPMA